MIKLNNKFTGKVFIGILIISITGFMAWCLALVLDVNKLSNQIADNGATLTEINVLGEEIDLLVSTSIAGQGDRELLITKYTEIINQIATLAERNTMDDGQDKLATLGSEMEQLYIVCMEEVGNEDHQVLALDQKAVVNVLLADYRNLVRTSSRNISLALMSKWKQVFAIVIISCLLGLLAVVLLIITRKKHATEKAAREELGLRSAELKEAKEELENRVVERTRALDEKKEYLRHVMDSNPNIIYVLDEDEKVALANQAVADLLEIDVTEMINLTLDEIERMVADDRQEHLEAMRPKKMSNGSFTQISTNENIGRKWFQKLTVPISMDDGETNQVLVVASDISDRKMIEERLSQKNEQLIKSNDELESFAYVASHDLQEPLRNIASYVQLLDRKYSESLDDEAKQFIQFAVNGAKRMQSIIRDLLQYSRVGNQKLRTFENVDLNDIIDQVLQHLHSKISDGNVDIDITKLPVLKADRLLMEQLFLNLLSNAIKFRSERAPHIQIKFAERADDWLFSVEDNGIGIPEEHKNRIFQMFQRLHGRDKYEGTGIGLAICKRIIEGHGGQIRVESEIGRGATFHFTISKNPNRILSRPESGLLSKVS